MLTIDFEASCLPRDGRSFPIEVAVADLDGNCRSWLIAPAPAWNGWTWTEEAEALHGLRRDQLVRDGQRPEQVMRELNAVVAGRRVIADHHLDQRWLATLAEASGIAPSFRIGHVSELLDVHCPSAGTLERATAKADLLVSQRHRAAADARWLAIVARDLIVAAEAQTVPLFAWSEARRSVESLPSAA